MFRHCVMFTWADGVTEPKKQAVRDALAELPSLIGEIRSYSFGDDAGLVEQNFDFVVVADFDDAAGYRAYSTHPEHLRVIADHIRPILGQRAAVQYELAP